jgi:hypothetical protein
LQLFTSNKAFPGMRQVLSGEHLEKNAETGSNAK